MNTNNGEEFATDFLQPTIDNGVDQLVDRAQNIALDRLIEDKLEALKLAGQDLKTSVNERVDHLILQANEKRPSKDDFDYEEKIQLYNAWLDEVTKGVRRVKTFFENLWEKIDELLTKIFTWIRDGFKNLTKKISRAFHIIKTTLTRENQLPIDVTR
mgnify:CR=1 FL=1